MNFLRLIGLTVILLATSSTGSASVASIDLKPSKSVFEPGGDFDLEVWLRPGETGGGSIDFSSAEFDVIWDTPLLLPRPGADPTLGPWTDHYDPHGFSYAKFMDSNRARISSTPWLEIPVDGHGLLLMILPLTAFGPAGSSIDFFMEGDYGESTIWLDGLPVNSNLVAANGASVSTVSLPKTAILFFSGLILGLIALKRKLPHLA